MAPRIGFTNFEKPNKTTLEPSHTLGHDLRQSTSSMALGVGEMASRYKGSFLPGEFASTASKLASGLPRFAGGLVTLGFAAYDIGKAFQFDVNTGANNFPETRREIFSTSVSAAAGLGAGAVAGSVAAAATALGAPIVVISGIGVAGILGIGYAASKARDWATEWWES